MKLLHIMPYSPVPPTFASTLQMYHLLKHMAKYHKVTVLTFGTPEDRHDFQKDFNGKLKATHFVRQPIARRYRPLRQSYFLWTYQSFFYIFADSKKMQTIINHFLDKDSYDIIHTEFAQMGFYDFQIYALNVLDTHNIEFEILQQMSQRVKSPIRKLHYQHKYKNFIAEEIEAYKKQNAIFTNTQRDKDIITKHVPDIPKFLVHNNVDTSYFSPIDEPVESYSMVFNAMIVYLPNSDGILCFFDDIYPLFL
ncbi:MAG: glycosyltransferase [Bacteroidota bacterium]|nr:glycosyltransferase [Bacteroidota bacterium]